MRGVRGEGGMEVKEVTLFREGKKNYSFQVGKK